MRFVLQSLFFLPSFFPSFFVRHITLLFDSNWYSSAKEALYISKFCHLHPNSFRFPSIYVPLQLRISNQWGQTQSRLIRVRLQICVSICHSNVYRLFCCAFSIWPLFFLYQIRFSNYWDQLLKNISQIAFFKISASISCAVRLTRYPFVRQKNFQSFLDIITFFSSYFRARRIVQYFNV